MNSTLDDHGQPVISNFSRKRNQDKALQSLAGILQGVTADQKLNEVEVLFLDAWLKSGEEYKDDGDFLDVMDIIEEALEDGIIEQHELAEIQSVLSDVVEYREQSGDVDALTNKLLGFLQGITSDDVINDKEIQALIDLLGESEELCQVWPANVIISRLEAILEDGIVDDEERAELLSMLKSICGQGFLDTGSAECFATDFFGEQIDLDGIEGKAICFTGKFLSGNRKSVEAAAKEKGAIVRSDVVKALDYLVIGSLASRDWKFSSHGRKIEAAIRNKQNGVATSILTEETWAEFIS
ncbi:BRCT domain-containing protein [Vibrio sp. SCSIO 43136]|uniref:BRCT domain-containing protein n=1 Tax=Vibrio sp. SCSIO 43136 TaxID=2819101 RepID=UPI002075A4A6|nr:BRCT domain-containing protein [Vibrio sp. SCSIO 43136]USD67155.1 BRCT domain-containing protein [Vibrio sp. SCSIO 43136]